MTSDTDPQPTAPADRAVQAFAGDTAAPGHARLFVVNVLTRWGRPDLIDDAVLVASELATNAVIHCRSQFLVQLRRNGSNVRIEVIDDSSREPVPTVAGQLATSGRGLSLVEAVSRDWGFDLIDPGKAVWAEFDATV
jgi:anti-sigma regulatory factor (Ser/Thr protein kinase)